MNGEDNDLVIPPIENPDEVMRTVEEVAKMETETSYNGSEDSEVSEDDFETGNAEMHQLTLHQCAREGIAMKMLGLLKEKPSLKKRLDEHDEEGQSPLHYAARNNKRAIVAVLVKAGANVNNKTEDGATPLHFAAWHKHKQQQKKQDDEINGEYYLRNSVAAWTVITYLVHEGAEINEQDNDGSTPLHFAAMRGSTEACEDLVNLPGIKIETTDHQRMRALHLAAIHQKEEIVKILIDKGAKLDCFDYTKRTPLYYACKADTVGVAKLLINETETRQGKGMVKKLVTDLDNQHKTPLHVAVENGCSTTVKLLIDNGAGIDKIETCHSKPLHLAAVSGNTELLRLLLESSASIDALDCARMTPLHHAAAHNQWASVELLLQRGAKLNELDIDDMSPLLVAAYNGHTETIKTLMKFSPIYDVDKKGRNAVYLAAERNHLKAMEVLIKKGPNGMISEADRFGNTPLHIAAQHGFFQGVTELVKRGAPMDAKNEEEQTPLHVAARNGKTEVVSELLANNARLISVEDEGQNTALHLAASYGHSETALTLINAAANVTARNRGLWTALDCAAVKGHTEVVKVLLLADAPLANRDKNKKTPLLLACERGEVSVVNTLIDWGASVTMKDRKGQNSLDLAIKHGHKEVALAIVQSSQWKKALQNENWITKKRRRDTPMRKLIRHMPDIAEVVFTKCIETRPNNPDDHNYEVVFNYEFLDDAYKNWRGKDSNTDKPPEPYSTDASVLKENNPLTIMVKHNQTALLAHPLVTSLLLYKWHKFGKFVYYTNLGVFCLFLFCLTVYVMETTAPYMYTNVTHTVDFCEHVKALRNVKQPLIGTVGKYIVMLLAVLNLVREILQFRVAKLNYVNAENVMEVITYIGSILFVMDFSQCQEETGIRMDWQWQLGAVAVFLAWMSLLLFVRKFPYFGIYIVMFTDILQTFLKFFPVFFLFVIAFSLAFFMLMQNMYAFRRPEFSLLKTSVMTIGEFDFDNIFYGMGSVDETDPEEVVHRKTLYYSTITYTVFAAFLIIMAILVTNLLVGLAVDDIKAVQEQAILKKLAMQVKLVLDVESIIPQYFRSKCVPATQKLRPNINHKDQLILNSLTEDADLSSDIIMNTLNPKMTEMQQLQKNLTKLRSETTELKSMIKDLMKKKNEDGQR